MLKTLERAETKLARKLQLALENLPVAVREYPTPITSRAATPSSLHDPKFGVEDMNESEDESNDDSDEKSDEDMDDQSDMSDEVMDNYTDASYVVSRVVVVTTISEVLTIPQNRQDTPTYADAEGSSIADDDFDLRSDFALDLELREGLQNISPDSPTSSDEDADMELVAPLPLQHYTAAGYSASGSGSSDHGQPTTGLSYNEEVVNGDGQGVVHGWEQNVASGSGSTAGGLDLANLGGRGIADGGSGSQGSRCPSFYSSQGDDNASVRPVQVWLYVLYPPIPHAHFSSSIIQGDLERLEERLKDLETEVRRPFLLSHFIPYIS